MPVEKIQDQPVEDIGLFNVEQMAGIRQQHEFRPGDFGMHPVAELRAGGCVGLAEQQQCRAG